MAELRSMLQSRETGCLSEGTLSTWHVKIVNIHYKLILDLIWPVTIDQVGAAWAVAFPYQEVVQIILKRVCEYYFLTAPDWPRSDPILNRKNQTCLIFPIPGYAASDGIPAKAKEREQLGEHQQPDVALSVQSASVMYRGQTESYSVCVGRINNVISVSLSLMDWTVENWYQLFFELLAFFCFKLSLLCWPLKIRCRSTFDNTYAHTVLYYEHKYIPLNPTLIQESCK